MLAGFGLSTNANSISKLLGINAGAAVRQAYFGDDYKALICLFMAGGNDSYNMLIPRGNAEYQEYLNTRTNLALRQNDLLNLNGTFTGKSFGVHPNMPAVQSLFNEKKLSFISNTGTLIQPVSKEEYDDKKVPLPLGLFSHSDQINQWQTAQSLNRANIGWGGKLAEMVLELNTSNSISMNMSLSGTNVFQFGNQIVQYSVSPNGNGFGIKGYQGENRLNQARTILIDGLLQHNYEDKYKKTYANVIKESIESQRLFQETLESVNEIQTPFANNRLSNSFKTIARIIRARDILGFKRQIFFVQVGGWDHHDRLLARHNGLIGGVSNALGEFAQALEEINVFDQVLTFTMSEFGRTLTSNGDGSDHAWGGNAMVMGGMIDGGKIFGEFPSLEIDNPLDLGRGKIIPTLSTDEYFAELAMWFGASPSDLPTILPNIGNFYSGGDAMPIGFISK